MTTTPTPGAAAVEDTIKVNHPLEMDGAGVFLLGNGYAPVVTIKDGSPVRPIATESTELIAIVPAWLEADHDGLSGRVLRLPDRHEIQVPITEHLIVELAGRK